MSASGSLARLLVLGVAMAPASAQRVLSIEELSACLETIETTDWMSRVQVLCNRSERLTRVDLQRARSDARSAMTLAEEHQDSQALALAFNARGLCEFRQGRLQDALVSHSAALDHGTAARDPHGVGRANLGLARCSLYVGDLAPAEEYLARATEELEVPGTDSDWSDLHNQTAILHQARFELRAALEEYLVALEHAEIAEDAAAQSRLHYNLGTLKINLDDAQGAASSLRRALELKGDATDSRYSGLLFASLGENARERGESDQARQWFERGIADARQSGNLSIEALHLRHLAGMDFDDGEYSRAENGYRISLERSLAAQQKEAIATSTAYLARALAAQGQFEEALDLCDTARPIAADLGMPTVEVSLAEVMSEVYACAGEFETALELQRRHTSLRLTIESEMRSAETNRLRLQLERVEAERDLSIAKREAEARAKREALLLSGSLGGAAVLSLALLAAVRSSRQKTELNRQLERQNRAIALTNDTVLGLNAELERTLGEVRQLSGLLPICCHCKSIRNDEGYWCEVEGYISAHSEALFSHGICPDCLSNHYETELN